MTGKLNTPSHGSNDLQKQPPPQPPIRLYLVDANSVSSKVVPEEDEDESNANDRKVSKRQFGPLCNWREWLKKKFCLATPF
jgi:hypothetical protein